MSAQLTTVAQGAKLPSILPKPKPGQTAKPGQAATLPLVTSTPHLTKKTREAWPTAAQEHLLSWMEETGNYDRYRSATKVLDGRQRSSGETKVSISKQIVTYLAGFGVNKTDKQIRTKITSFEDKWKEAHILKDGTGYGLTDVDSKEYRDLQAKIRNICEHWDRLDPILRDRAGFAAPFTADSEDPVDESIFTDLNSPAADSGTAMQETQSEGTVEPITQAEAEVLGLDDGRTPLQKRVDGDGSPSEEEEATTSSDKKKKRVRSAVLPKKKDKATELVDLLMVTSKEKKERSEQRNTSAEERFLKRFEFEVKKHNDNHDIQMRDMSLRERELKLRETEAENRKLELLKHLADKS